MIIERTLIRDTDPPTLHCGICGRPMRVCRTACQQRQDLLIGADGYLRHDGRVYALTMDEPCHDRPPQA